MLLVCYFQNLSNFLKYNLIRYQTRQTVPYQEQATYVEEPAENNQRRQDSGFQDPGTVCNPI